MARGQKARPIIERLMDKVILDEATGCWLWSGATESTGYGQIRECSVGGVKGCLKAVHRVTYEHFVGPVPAGLVLDHFVCEVRNCANPQHVRPVTTRENVLRGDTLAARYLAQTHCKQGHEFNEKNTRFDKNGDRACRVCNRDAVRRYLQRKKAA